MGKNILTILFIFLFLCSTVYAENITKKRIIRDAEIKVLPINDTILAICPPKDNYYVEPGETVSVKLFIRNAMNDKVVKRIDLKVVTDERFNTSFSPKYVQNLEIYGDLNVQFFIINFTASNDMPFGNYNARFDLGTDEFEIGSYSKEVNIKVRAYSNEFIYTLYTILIIITISIVIRFFWILNTNRNERLTSNKSKRKITKHSKKVISEKYYKD